MDATLATPTRKGLRTRNVDEVASLPAGKDGVGDQDLETIDARCRHVAATLQTRVGCNGTRRNPQGRGMLSDLTGVEAKVTYLRSFL